MVVPTSFELVSRGLPVSGAVALGALALGVLIAATVDIGAEVRRSFPRVMRPHVAAFDPRRASGARPRESATTSAIR